MSTLLAVGWAVMLFVVAAGCARLVRGPTTLDRLLGFDTATVGGVGIIALFSLGEGTGELMELVLIVTALSFVTTVAFFYYLSQPKRRSHEDFNLEDDEVNE